MRKVLNYSKWVLLGIFSVCPALISTNAFATSFTFDSVGDMVTFDYSLDVGGGNILTGTTKYTATAISSGGITLQTVVKNTSTTGTNQGLKSVGFQATSPELSTVSFSQQTPAGDTNVFSNALLNTTFPGFHAVELCVLNGNNCSGGAQGTTLAEGQTDTFLLGLTFSTSAGTPPSFTIDGPRIRFKGALGSYTFAGTNGDPVPEPSTVLLFGSGLTGLMLWRWKHSKK